MINKADNIFIIFERLTLWRLPVRGLCFLSNFAISCGLPRRLFALPVPFLCSRYQKIHCQSFVSAAKNLTSGRMRQVRRQTEGERGGGSNGKIFFFFRISKQWENNGMFALNFVSPLQWWENFLKAKICLLSYCCHLPSEGNLLRLAAPRYYFFQLKSVPHPSCEVSWFKGGDGCQSGGSFGHSVCDFPLQAVGMGKPSQKE